MTTDYLKTKRIEDILNCNYKTLKYCGFKMKKVCNWEKNIFAIQFFNISDEDYKGLLEYQENGIISKEIQILRMA